MARIVGSWIVKVVARAKDDLSAADAETVRPISNVELDAVVAAAIVEADPNVTVTVESERTDA